MHDDTSTILRSRVGRALHCRFFVAPTLTIMAAALLVLVSLAACAGVVNAYGYLSFPPATYRDVTRSQLVTTMFNSSIHPTFFVMRNSFTTRNRAATFVRRLEYADFSSLREIADILVPGCGNTVIDEDVEAVNVFGAKRLLWRNQDEKIGFYQGTEGPCETWIDDNLVQRRVDCVSSYRTYPAQIPINFRRCPLGKICVLRFYWLVVDSLPFKLMTEHCVRITNNPFAPTAKENLDPFKLSPKQAANNQTIKIDITITIEGT